MAIQALQAPQGEPKGSMPWEEQGEKQEQDTLERGKGLVRQGTVNKQSHYKLTPPTETENPELRSTYWILLT